MVFRLRDARLNPRLGFVLGMAVTLIQYPAELAVRKLSPAYTDTFLLGYLLLSPICCAAIVFLNSRKVRQRATSQ
jgi:hypothetical protein